MRTFFSTPNSVIEFKPAIGKEHITSISFDDNGMFSTDHELIIEKFFHVYDSMPTPTAEEIKDTKPEHSCKKCEFVGETRQALMSHYKTNHPKEK